MFDGAITTVSPLLLALARDDRAIAAGRKREGATAATAATAARAATAAGKSCEQAGGQIPRGAMVDDLLEPWELPAFETWKCAIPKDRARSGGQASRLVDSLSRPSHHGPRYC